MKRILCFGDSNTWGYMPRTDLNRYPEGVRWTSRLQAQLGTDYKVLEFGLCGCRAGGKGAGKFFNTDSRILFPSVLVASLPVDIVIIMLGTNDLKTANEWKPGDTAQALRELVRAANMFAPKARVVLAAPVLLDERVLQDVEFPPTTVADSAACAKEVAELCNEEHLPFFDTNAVVHGLGIDGCHFTPESHAAFADAMTVFLREAV